MKLIIGNKNYSSWSLRPWLLLKYFDVQFEELVIPLYQDNSAQLLAHHSPSLKVPVLQHNALSIWDSLAICEYINEQLIAHRGLPRDINTRALCRAYCAEMHSSFEALRLSMPMDCRRRRALKPSAACDKDIQRIDTLWQQALSASDGPFLFGEFSMADCMYAPVVSRFNSYAVTLSSIAETYKHTILALPAMQQWTAAAESEKWEIPTPH